MSFTPEEKIKYWKQRCLDHIISGYKQLAADYNKVINDATHAGLNTAPVMVAMSRIEEDMKKLLQEISDMKVFEAKDNGGFKDSMEVKENVEVQLSTPAEAQ